MDDAVWIDNPAEPDNVQAFATLLDVFRERWAESWRRHAACIGVDTDAVFFDDARRVNPEAERLCGICPVLDECREWALSQPGTPYGFVGGMSARERMRERRMRRREAA